MNLPMSEQGDGALMPRLIGVGVDEFVERRIGGKGTAKQNKERQRKCPQGFCLVRRVGHVLI